MSQNLQNLVWKEESKICGKNAVLHVSQNLENHDENVSGPQKKVNINFTCLYSSGFNFENILWCSWKKKYLCDHLKCDKNLLQNIDGHVEDDDYDDNDDDDKNLLQNIDGHVEVVILHR